MRRLSVFLALVVVITACGDDDASPATTPITATTTTTTTTGAVTSSPATTPITTTPVTSSTLPSATLVVSGKAIEIEVIEVFDGDSFEARVDGRLDEIRLEGINAPERRECFADDARAQLIEGLAEGSVTIVETDRDQFGRILAYVIVGETNLNLHQVITGSAIATSYDHQAVNAFLDAEEGAFSNGRGIWAADACGEASAARVAVGRIEPNPSGRDEENLNGEWVGLVNDGDDVDLSGWVIRDESSTHRFTFPDGAGIADGGGVVVRTGCGNASDVEFFWCADGPVWSNGGDMVLLLDAAGTVIDRFRYQG